jgi:hypothetical protein
MYFKYALVLCFGLFLNLDSVESVDNSIIGFSAKEFITKSSLTRKLSNAKKMQKRIGKKKTIDRRSVVVVVIGMKHILIKVLTNQIET